MNVRHLSNDILMSNLHRLVADDCAMEAELLATIGEVDKRGLYRERAHPSMFQFCVDELHLSESVAGVRITVARATRRFPQLLEKIRSGELHLSGARMLMPHLDDGNIDELLNAATHKSRAQIEHLLASRYPKPDVPALVRKLPTKSPDTVTGSPSTESGASVEQQVCETSTPPCSIADTTRASTPRAPDPRATLEPLSAERYKVQFTADAELCAKLREAQELLGHSVRKGDLASIISKSLDLLVANLKNKKHGVSQRDKRAAPKTGESGGSIRDRCEADTSASVPMKEAQHAGTDQDDTHTEKTSRRIDSRSRYIPKSVRRTVFERDDGQCAYIDARGRRCCERAGLQYHHRVAFGRGGESTANLELRCFAHNQLAAEEEYGLARIEELRTRSGSRQEQPPRGARDQTRRT